MRKMWRVLAVAVGAQAAGSVAAQGVYVLVPVWKANFELSQGAASLAVTAMNAGQVLSLFVLGRAIDRYGERIVVGATMIAMGGCAGLAARVTTFPALLIFLMGLGALYAAVQPGGTRAILGWFPPGRRGLATGLRQAALPLGTAFAAALLPALAAERGWQIAVGLQGLIALLGGALFWLLYREPPHIAIAVEDERRSTRALLGILARTPGFGAVLGAGVAMSAFQYTFTAHVGSLLSEQFGFQLVDAAALFSFVQILGMAGRVGLAWISDRLWPGERARSLAWIMLAAALSSVILAILPSTAPRWSIVAPLCLFGIAGIGWFPLYMLEIAESAPGEAVAATVGLAFTACMATLIVAPLGFGVLVDAAGYSTALVALVAPVGVAAMPLFRRSLDPRRGAASK